MNAGQRTRIQRWGGGVDLERPLGKSGSGAPFSRQMYSGQPLLEVQCHPHSFLLSQGSLCRARPVPYVGSAQSPEDDTSFLCQGS